jgi:RNA polymerase sigma-70 factor (ECF subfamily)|tara:strand:+ start:192 stop:719 length:528 start_codon:yes stop_codon:yes gene_type:complete
MNDTEQKRILDEWLHTHRGLLFKALRAFAFSAHDQDDLFQEIAFQLWQSIPNFKGDSSVSTWVYRVALYSAIRWSQKEQRHNDKHEGLDVSSHIPRNQPPDDDPRVAWLYQQIGQLAPIDRSLILLQLEGLSYREMSEALGISESNVGVKINRIKNKMSQQSTVDPSKRRQKNEI